MDPETDKYKEVPQEGRINNLFEFNLQYRFYNIKYWSPSSSNWPIVLIGCRGEQSGGLGSPPVGAVN